MHKSEDLAYTAGLIDGEGCIQIARHNNQKTVDGHPRYVLMIRFNMVSAGILKWLCETYGGSFFPGKKPRNENWRQQWIWSLANRGGEDFLVLLLPYLRIKKAEAEVALEFRKTLLTDHHSKVTSELAEEREDMYWKLRLLKREA